MCDIWKANNDGLELTEAHLAPHLDSLKQLRVRRIVLTGGEALLHSNLWRLCEMLVDLRIKMTLITSGRALGAHADNVGRWCDSVIVSLDGSPAVHDRVRNVEGAFSELRDGVRALRSAAPKLRVSAQCVLQRMNYFDIGRTIETARQLSVDAISFRTVDVSSDAFERSVPWDGIGRVLLTPEETKHFELVIEAVLRSHHEEITSSFVEHRPEDFRGFARFFRAHNDEDSFPEPVCNAPWVSAVVHADGSVRPCTFHQPYGSIHDAALGDVVNSADAVRFREELDMSENPICRRCVSKRHLTPYQRP